MTAADAPAVFDRDAALSDHDRTIVNRIFGAMPFGAAANFERVLTGQDILVNLGKLRDTLTDHVAACERRDSQLYEFEQQRSAIRAFLGTAS